jgi:hypothetical protein
MFLRITSLQKKFFNLLILIVVALCPVYARSQQNGSTPPKADEAAEAALRDKAYDLLESLAGEIGTMQSPENRARIASNIAGSLWTHNETRARELFQMVQQDINTGLQVPDPDDAEDVHTLLVFLRLRMDTINRIAKHDPELAYEFFKATPLNPNLKLDEATRAGQEALEFQLAKQVAASSPELAVQLARNAMSHGFSDELRKIFKQLNRKHKDQAKALYKEIVEKLGEADLVKDWPTRYFALNFANSFKPPEIDESNFNDLINVFVKVAAANGCNRKIDQDAERSEACNSLIPLISVIAKANPARAKQFDNWLSEDEYSYWETSPYSEIEETATDATVEDVLALTTKYPRMENEIRWRAFLKAYYDGDLELARKIADETRESENKERMVNQLGGSNPVGPEIDNEKLLTLDQYLAQIKSPEQQVIFLAAAANQIGPTDRKAAFKLLNQASQLVPTVKPGREQITAQIGLAMVYCYFKSDQGLAIMQSLVPKLNELVEASAKLDGIEHRYLRNGEWNMSGEGVLGDLLTALANNANFFARCDFDRAVSLASQFDRPEIRIMAQLKLAQGILAGPVKPFPMGFTNYYR